MPGTLPQTEDHVDVLIVGAGPAGLMLANWLSRCDVKTRIVDKRGTKVRHSSCRGPCVAVMYNHTHLVIDLQRPSGRATVPNPGDLRLVRFCRPGMARVQPHAGDLSLEP
jgi:predicted NAD/FAD-dependent oxidoreductase